MNVCIFGSGSFGTSIAQHISDNVNKVYILSRNKDVIESINDKRVNLYYYPSVILEENISCHCISENEKIIDRSDLIIFSLPSGVTRDVASNISADFKGKLIISTSKGIEYPSENFMSQVLKQATKNSRVISFSGPTFADEMLEGYITCATFGIGDNSSETDSILNIFKTESFLYDTSEDITGVELCGVLKNIYSIAVGIFDSCSNSFNEHYAFLNLCFKEMRTIVEAYSEDKELIFKYCAFGDFNLTTNSDKSRNRTLGLMVGKGMLNLAEFNPSIIYEGLKSVKAIKQKCSNDALNAPIVDFVSNLLNNPENVKLKLTELIKKF